LWNSNFNPERFGLAHALRLEFGRAAVAVQLNLDGAHRRCCAFSVSSTFVDGLDSGQ